MKYKLGDKVRIRQDLNENEYYGGTRCNQIATINYFNEDEKFYRINLDNMNYRWTDAMFKDLVEYTYEDLCNAPVGTKISFESKDVLARLSKNKSHADFCWQGGNAVRGNNDLINMEDNYNDCRLGKIIKIEEPIYTTVYKVKKEILDKKEKEFLSNLIKLFKNRVIWISKMSYINYEYLEISYEEIAGYSETVSLPIFKKGTMYRGMEFDKEYSLEELGL